MPKPKPTRKPPARPAPPQSESPPASLKLEWIDPKLLAGNPKNWRRHPESQLAALAETLTQIGWAGACLFNRRTNRLVDGHARVEVAIQKNIPAVPVLVGRAGEVQTIITTQGKGRRVGSGQTNAGSTCGRC